MVFFCSRSDDTPQTLLSPNFFIERLHFPVSGCQGVMRAWVTRVAGVFSSATLAAALTLLQEYKPGSLLTHVHVTWPRRAQSGRH